MTTDQKRQSIRERYANVSTADASDALEILGHRDRALSVDIIPMSGSSLAGWAFTISGEMASSDVDQANSGGDPKKLEACAAIGPGEIAVWSGNGTGVCYFGDMFTIAMMQRGSVGAVLDGGIRDLPGLDALGYPVFARYSTPVQSNGRWIVTDWQREVVMPGATTEGTSVRPGDFILGDRDGVIVIPVELAEEVLRITEGRRDEDAAIQDALRAGGHPKEVRSLYGRL